MATRPETLFEAASYDLNKFRERRMAERRAMQRNTPDRRAAQNGNVSTQRRHNRDAERNTNTDDTEK